MSKYETRSYPVKDLEIRAEEDGGDTLVGRIVPFNSWSETIFDFREQVAPGAFGDLEGVDIKANIEHERTLTIARTPKTLTIEERKDGVWMTMRPADTRAARDAIELVRSGVIDGASIEFRVKPDGDRWDVNTVPMERTIEKDGATLQGFALTSWPAYSDTSAALRSLESWRESHPDEEMSTDKARRRLRLADAS